MTSGRLRWHRNQSHTCAPCKLEMKERFQFRRNLAIKHMLEVLHLFRWSTHTTLSHIFVTHNLLAHNVVKQNFVTHNSFTHNFVTHHLAHTTLSPTTLSRTIFHTHLSHMQLLFYTQLCHTQLARTQLCHTPSFTHNIVTHNFVTHNSLHTTFKIIDPPPDPVSFVLSPCRFNHFFCLLEDVDWWGYPVL